MLAEKTQIRDYTIISKIGEGGMGTVFLADDMMLERKVAIKVLHPYLTSDEKFTERFKKEAKVQATLAHPNIISLFNFFATDELYCIVLEYFDGNNLKNYIQENGLIPEERALKIFAQVLKAISFAQAKNIVHRDIKPSNILLNQDDEVKIMDFGIAKILGDKGMTKTGSKMGTTFYMSPEQVRADKNIDYRTDIFSLGITLYEMLTGRLPYNIDTDSDFQIMSEIVNKPLPDPREIYPHISDRTIEALFKATQKNADDRFQSIQEFYDELIGVKKVALPTKVFITSSIENIPIIINAVSTGQNSPTCFDNLSVGTHKIELFDDDHFSQAQYVELEADNKSLELYFEIKKYCYLSIESGYMLLNFKINSEALNLNKTLKLASGDYKVTVLEKGFPEIDFTLSEGESKVINYDEMIPEKEIAVISGMPGTMLSYYNKSLNISKEISVDNEVRIKVPIGKYEFNLLHNRTSLVRTVDVFENKKVVDFSEELCDEIKRLKKVRKAIIYSAAVIAVLIISLIISSRIRENSAWERAIENNTLASYSEYLDSYPSGRFIDQANSGIETASWIKAKKADSYESYDEYFTKYPSGVYSQEAALLMEDRLFQESTASKDASLFRKYINKYPNGKYFYEVQKAIKEFPNH